MTALTLEQTYQALAALKRGEVDQADIARIASSAQWHIRALCRALREKAAA